MEIYQKGREGVDVNVCMFSFSSNFRTFTPGDGKGTLERGRSEMGGGMKKCVLATNKWSAISALHH